MKELFRERDFTRMAFYQAILEREGIPTHIRNQYLTMSGLTEIPIKEFYPAVCVVNDEDYEEAILLLRQRAEDNQKNAAQELTCPSCSETNPGNFDVCWSCSADMKDEKKR